MPNDLTEIKPHTVPDWVLKASTNAPIGDIDPSDLTPPFLKILAGQSPEVIDAVPDAQVGKFWMTVLERSLGTEVAGTPIWVKKSYKLWAPRLPGSANRGPLAIADGKGRWDFPNQKFQIRFPPDQGGGEYVWEIKNTVFENGMHERGSSKPDFPDSLPAAQLTYDHLWVIDLPDGDKQLCIFTSKSTGVTPTEKFMSTCSLYKAKGVNSYYQRWRIISKRKTSKAGHPYFSFDYSYEGPLQNEADGKMMHALYDQYSKSGFEGDLVDEMGPPPPPPQRSDPEDDDIPF